MNITGWQLAIVALLILLLFGAPKLPGLAKSVGQSMRIFRSEVRSLHEDDENTSSSSASSSSRDGRTVEGPVVNGEPPRAAGPTEAEQHRRPS